MKISNNKIEFSREEWLAKEMYESLLAQMHDSGRVLAMVRAHFGDTVEESFYGWLSR